jgi:hypothetical protein
VYLARAEQSNRITFELNQNWLNRETEKLIATPLSIGERETGGKKNDPKRNEENAIKTQTS